MSFACARVRLAVQSLNRAEDPPRRSDYYYDCLRKDLGERHPKVDPHLLDHLVCPEACLDKN